MTDVKTDLRRNALARRDLVSPEEARAAAEAVRRRGLELAEDIAERNGFSAPVVSVYWPIRSEVNTRPLIEALADRGFEVALPAMRAVRQPLDFRLFSPGDLLVKGPFGLSEPAADSPEREPDIIFAPLAAFDRRGYRLGYGGGIYDATLAQLRKTGARIAIGLAYALQEAAEIPIEPHDQRLDYLLTEKELIVPA